MRQNERSREKNAAFFRDHLEQYRQRVATLDTYQNIRTVVNGEIAGIGRLLDVGNGGTFDYDVRLPREVTAVDLFLEDLPPDALPANVQAKNGSALDLPFPAQSFDGVLMAMLIHHLTGDTVRDSLENLSRAIGEAARVLKPEGKLIVVESCVPDWFYRFERLVYQPTTRIVSRFFEHPPALQFPPEVIREALDRRLRFVRFVRIPKGKWILQYGRKYPSALTPVEPCCFVYRKI